MRDGRARPARVPLLVADRPTWVAGVPKADLVVSGTEVVDAIEGVRTGRKGMHDDVPLEDVVIQRVVAV